MQLYSNKENKETPLLALLRSFLDAHEPCLYLTQATPRSFIGTAQSRNCQRITLLLSKELWVILALARVP